jgi:hypothetical protein
MILVKFIVQCNIYSFYPVQTLIGVHKSCCTSSVSPPPASGYLSIRIGTLLLALVKWRTDWTREIDSDQD